MKVMMIGRICEGLLHMDFECKSKSVIPCIIVHRALCLSVDSGFSQIR